MQTQDISRRRITIFDTTLRDGEQSPGCSMNLTEKLDVARQLDKLGVDVIEAGFPASSPEDFAAVRAVCAEVQNASVAALSRAIKSEIMQTYEAVCDAAQPVIHTVIATSDIHMQYKLHKTPEEVLEQAVESVKFAKRLCSRVEFSAEDATRSDRDFLVKVYSAVIAAGATVINVPDTVGYTTPREMAALIAYLREHIEGIENAAISVHCHNDLGLAVANSLAGLTAGATQVECTLCGIGERAGNASLEEIAMGLAARGDFYGLECGINTRRIYRASRVLSSVIGASIPPNKPIIGANVFAHESGIHQHGVLSNPLTYEILTPESIGVPQSRMVLGKHSGRHAFADHIADLGYELSGEALDAAFERFKELADRKKMVTDSDIEALLNTEKTGAEPYFKLNSFVVNSGTNIPATATISLSCEGETLSGVAAGSGPIDAAFTALEQMIQSGARLDAYSIQSVTEGEDALGEVTVRLLHEGRRITGRGLSTDIIEASIKAYLGGMNKIFRSARAEKK